MKPANTNDPPVSATLGDVPKDDVVRLRVTTEERARWQAAAAADQRTLSDWLRVVANAASAPAEKPKRKARR